MNSIFCALCKSLYPTDFSISQEFAERWEVDRYLSANGVLGDGVKPFFVALPKDRSIQNNTDFRRQIAAVDSEILRQLREGISGGFDEERFGGQIGFGNLRRFLEQELQRRYTILLFDDDFASS